MPILTAFECALNRDLLLECEKKSLYFAFDTKEITKSDIRTWVEAFKTALKEIKIELDDEVAGRFVEKTVARAIDN